MRRLSMFFVLFSVGLTAQTPAGTTSAVLIQPPASQSCPVTFSVERKSNEAMVEVKSAPTLSGAKRASESHGQGLQFSFAESPTSAIVKAEITVHGSVRGAQVIPASTRTKAAEDSTETIELGSDAGPKLLHPAIWTKKMTAITWVELTKLVYADKSTWESSPQSRCTAAPSLVVLVDSAH